MGNIKYFLIIITALIFSCNTKPEIKPTENKLNGNELREKKDKQIPDTELTSFQIDSFKTVIIANQHLIETEFGKGHTAYTPEMSEINDAERLLMIWFNEEKIPKLSRLYGRNLDEYIQQYVSLKDEIGNKIIWINCFCKRSSKYFKNWKTEIVKFVDGGNCFFNVRIDMKKKAVYDLNVNSDNIDYIF